MRTGTIGLPQREALFALKKVNAKFEEIKLSAQDQIILVDASEVKAIPAVPPSQVIEIIDHRKIHEADKFSNAKVQIELVGAAATLVAERFYKEKVELSKESASLL